MSSFMVGAMDNSNYSLKSTDKHSNKLPRGDSQTDQHPQATVTGIVLESPGVSE